jgi:tetratricopeptide (TPR) repeat protein
MRRPYVRIGIMTLLVVCCCPGGTITAQEEAQNHTATFDRANILYAEARYDEAIVVYLSILDDGVENGNVYYNLGNCYFKKDLPGKAILYYERAKRLMPRDRDLIANHDYATSKTKGHLSMAQKMWLKRFMQRFFDQFTVDGITIFVAVLYVVVIALIVVRMVLRNGRGYANLAIGIALLMGIVGIVDLHAKTQAIGKEGVVVQETVEATFEPVPRAATHFTLYEGMGVRILSSQGDWSKIKRNDGKVGWIPNTTFEII